MVDKKIYSNILNLNMSVWFGVAWLKVFKLKCSCTDTEIPCGEFYMRVDPLECRCTWDGQYHPSFNLFIPVRVTEETLQLDSPNSPAPLPSLLFLLTTIFEGFQGARCSRVCVGRGILLCFHGDEFDGRLVDLGHKTTGDRLSTGRWVKEITERGNYNTR